jgi:hypothetical protein
VRVRIIRNEVYNGSVFLEGDKLDLETPLAEQLIEARVAIALDHDELVFTPVAEAVTDEEVIDEE